MNFSQHLTTAVISTGAGAGVDSAWEQRKLEARKILENAAESPASSAPEKIARDHFIREKQGCSRQPTKVYSEAASTQAVQSNGERVKRLPQCTVVSGQIDLNIGGAKTVFWSCGDPVEKANTLK